MGKIYILAEKEDEDIKKLEWLSNELKKREFEVNMIPMPDTEDFDEWNLKFREISAKIDHEFMVLAKGTSAIHTLKEFTLNKIAAKGLFLFTDRKDHYGLLNQSISKSRDNVKELFIYAFQESTDLRTLEQMREQTDHNDAQLFVLEGTEDFSDYEDALADILSLENSA